MPSRRQVLLQVRRRACSHAAGMMQPCAMRHATMQHMAHAYVQRALRSATSITRNPVCQTASKTPTHACSWPHAVADAR
eukprot:322737-Chlamydomonas_euryale.AAC.4